MLGVKKMEKMILTFPLQKKYLLMGNKNPVSKKTQTNGALSPHTQRRPCPSLMKSENVTSLACFTVCNLSRAEMNAGACSVSRPGVGIRLSHLADLQTVYKSHRLAQSFRAR